jgi:rfaE bifunctional protein kinase chain/domain
MNEQRLCSILNRFRDTRILVVGDYFLDHYLVIDRALSEISLETGLEAYQVVEVRCSPGAAGTVTSNLRALGIRVTALGVIGDDGMGYELLRGLRDRGVDVEPLIQVGKRFTPTYTKPMLREADGYTHEIQRMDTKNRDPLPVELEKRIIALLREWIGHVQGIVIADQVPERNCGVITDCVRSAIIELAQSHPNVIVAADSRTRIGEYVHVVTKPNAVEAARAIYPGQQGIEADRAEVEACGHKLYQRTGRTVYLTIGPDGVLVFDRDGMMHVPGIHVTGPIDIVGAGDSTMAGIVSSLCCDATPAEAALIGNLVASITIQQIGTTGTATQAQVMARYRDTLL